MSAAPGGLVATCVQKFGPPHALCYYSAEPVFASSQGNMAKVQKSGHQTITEKVGCLFNGAKYLYQTQTAYLAGQSEQ